MFINRRILDLCAELGHVLQTNSEKTNHLINFYRWAGSDFSDIYVDKEFQKATKFTVKYNMIVIDKTKPFPNKMLHFMV